MGYIMIMSQCFGCGMPFFYNPNKVPSISINGDRKPICGMCVDRVNPKRIANGLEPIVPAPDAYEPIDENEL